MLIRQYMYTKLSEIIKAAYPDEKKYTSFYIQLLFNENKRPSASYDFYDNRITVNTLSRKPGIILIDCLAAIAKHIDIQKRGETHNDKNYLDILKKLLDISLSRNLIKVTDLYLTTNEKIKSDLQKNYGSFRNWCIKSESNFHPKIYVLVYESFMIKNILKANDYKYDISQQSWTKLLDYTDYQDESEFILQYKHKADFKVIDDNSFFIKPCYNLKVSTYSMTETKLWHALGFRFDQKTKLWHKAIFANELKVELESIADLPKQNVYISELK